jgi:hypothetical protein
MRVVTFYFPLALLAYDLLGRHNIPFSVYQLVPGWNQFTLRVVYWDHHFLENDEWSDTNGLPRDDSIEQWQKFGELLFLKFQLKIACPFKYLWEVWPRIIFIKIYHFFSKIWIRTTKTQKFPQILDKTSIQTWYYLEN